ncbi:MAG: hypothetical protein R3237_00645 [Nitrosopumilaceae archaeon]|nr:hypothetical protein [Nitrosopumilaceae archaeon]
METKSEPPESMIFTQNYLFENMKKSYEFWHQIYDDSPINIPLVWKKALESNSRFLNQLQEAWKINTRESESNLQKFLESWGNSIKESNFQKATKSLSQYLTNFSDSQTKFNIEILKMLEEYWRNIQDKNIE